MITNVAIDQQLCTGHGRCYSLEPDLFTDDDAGFGSVRTDVDVSNMDGAAHAAALNCPEGAVRVTSSHATKDGEST